MNLFTNVSFWLEQNSSPKNLVTEDVLNTIVNPSGNWVLQMTFDERALSKKFQAHHDSFNKLLREEIPYDQRVNYNSYTDEDHCHGHGSEEYLIFHINRTEYFRPDATLRDVLTRVTKGKCFGYFEGIECVGKNRYVLNYGM